MGALFDDVAVVEDDDTVGIADGAETVGDDKGGATLHQRVHASLNEPFRTSVDGGCCLVEDEYRRIRDSSSCNGDELSLTLGEVAAIAVENSLIAVAQTSDEVVGSHQTSSTDAVFVRSTQTSVTDIVDDGACEEMCLLKYDAHRLAERLLANVCQRNAVVEDLSFLNLVEAVNEVDDGGLAGARTSYEGNLLAWVGVDVYIEEHLLGWRVAEVYIGKIHITPNGLRFEVWGLRFEVWLPLRELSISHFP